jgi:hypothetical protein
MACVHSAGAARERDPRPRGCTPARPRPARRGTAASRRRPHRRTGDGRGNVAGLTEAWTMVRHDGVDGSVGWHGGSVTTGGERRGGVDSGIDGSDATVLASDRARAWRQTAAVETLRG